jgi:hypothetical protein
VYLPVTLDGKIVDSKGFELMLTDEERHTKEFTNNRSKAGRYRRKSSSAGRLENRIPRGPLRSSLSLRIHRCRSFPATL